MRRVLVIGPGGSGKTTLSRALARATGLLLVHLDAEYWRAGWQPTPEPEWRRRVEELVALPSWIMDGNYGGTFDLRFPAADTVVFLDRGGLACTVRVVGRWLRHRGRTRPSLPPGCRERLTPAFLHWIWTYRSRRRPALLDRLASPGAPERVHVLRSDREVEAFLDFVRAGGA